MSELENPYSRTDIYGRRTNRTHSPLRAALVPYLSVIIASLIPIYFITSSVPLMPPIAFIALIAWRMARPGLFPPWIGLPLGGFDDLFSGQPFGSAVLLWSVAMLTLEIVEDRFPWRGFWQDWLAASLAIGGYIILALLISGASINPHQLWAITPQIALSIIAYPLFVQVILQLDRYRLMRVKEIY